MPSILVVYYSQTGQLLKLAKSMLSNIPADITVDYELKMAHSEAFIYWAMIRIMSKMCRGT